ncbi:MAG: hypothetical protein DI569_07755 [Sphingopyxis macrogoltabida]|uniref:TonB-dependent receptor n=1 Tax=Sphingopyxis macrogoltabida TaxID=33050 RepID=A0A2W5L7S2_SPHMC|nr:MAG: hypothetical protein DI569_07755 [Sphingopyxis macrogoltabida]
MKNKALLLLGAALVGLPHAGYAQEAAAPPADDAEQASAGIGDIVVTAQRREERLQDVPVAISAFSASTLETAEISSTQELTKLTSGLNFTRGAYAPQATIRGIGTRGVNAGDESVVPIFIDGVYQPFLVGGFIELNNLERVEVLKGPQGALLGRNATGGAINLITTTPSDEFRARASIGYGRFDLVEIKGYVSGGAGPIAADLGVIYSDDNGYIRNIVTGKKTGDRNGLSIRSKVKLDISDAVETTLTYSHVERFSADSVNQPINGNSIGLRAPNNGIAATRPFETASNLAFLDLNQDSLALSLTIRGSAFDVHGVASYQDNVARAPADSDGTSLVAAGFDNTYKSRSLYLENYLTSNGNGPFKWLVGAVYFHDRSTFDPLQAYSNGALALKAFSRQWTDSFAVYGQGSYDLTDRLTFTVSGRYTLEDKKAQFDRLAPTVLTGRRYGDSFNRFTPSGTLSYEIVDGTNVYVKAGQAFKSGLFNSSTVATRAVDPEIVTQYEAGIKSDPLPWLRTNFAAYYTDYKDIQVTARDAVTGVPLLQNAASARIYGFEGDIAIRASQALNIRAGGSLLKATYKDFPDAVVTIPATNGMGVPIGGNVSVVRDVSGNDLAKMPRVSGHIGADYTVGVGGGQLVLAGNVNYEGKFYWDSLNRIKQKPVTLADASLSWAPDSEAWKVTVWGKNLFDEVYNSQIVTAAAGDAGSYAQPATYGVRFEVKFR